MEQGNLQVKASMGDMYELHSLLAKKFLKLMESDDIDVKELSAVAKFLKDNEVTVDIVESNAMKSLTDSIKQIANKEEQQLEFSVEDMLAITEK